MRSSTPSAEHEGRAARHKSRSLFRTSALFVMLAALFYLPVLLGFATFPSGDFTDHFLPFAQRMAEAWRTLEAPIWNIHTYAGHPFWADVQAAVLYPVSNLILLLTLPFVSDAARLYFLQVEAVLHIALAGLFTYALVRELTGHRWAGMLAGATFMFSGYLTGYPPLQLAVLRTAIWLPLLLWLLLKAWPHPQRWRYWVGAGVGLAVAFSAGHPQTWMYMAYAVLGWVVTLSFGYRTPRGDGQELSGRYRVLGLVAAVLIGAGLAAAQLLPSVEFTRFTVRADVGYDFLSGGFPLEDTWQMLLPGVLTHFSPLYVGVVSLGLAFFTLVAVPAYGKPDSGRVNEAGVPRSFALSAAIYFAAVALVGLLASYGGNAFLYPLLYRVAPGWDMFRGQERAAYLVAFALSVLAGYGLALAPAAPASLRRRYALIYGAVVTASVYSFGLIWQLPGRTAIGQWRYLGIAAGTLLLAMALALVLWTAGWNLRREWLLCGVAILNLWLANLATNLVHRTPAQAVIQPAEVVALRSAAESYAGPTGLPGRAYNEYRVYEDYGMRAGVEDVWGSSPLRLTSYSALFDEFPLDRMFQLTGVAHVLTWRRELFEPSDILAEFPKSEDTTYVHRLSEPNPRLWIVADVVCADDEGALTLLADHDFDLGRSAVLPCAGESIALTGLPSAGEVRAERLQTNRLGIDVAGSGGGILIISENWMPGWRVENATCGTQACDVRSSHGAGLPILTPVRANLSFLAVALPVGDVDFDLVYRPRSIAIGALISGVALALLAVATVFRHVLQYRRRSD